MRTNWGALFVILFIALLLISAVFFSLGYHSSANDLAVYAFYSLVLGVALQIASYMKYGEVKPAIDKEPTSVETQKRSSPLKPKLVALAVVISAVMLIGSVAILQFYEPRVNLFSTRPYYASLTAGQVSYNILTEPDGSRIVLLAMSAFGGAAPFNFTANWGDGVNQTAASGIFQRPFDAGQIIPRSVTVSVRSSDGQIAKINVTIDSK